MGQMINKSDSGYYALYHLFCCCSLFSVKPGHGRILLSNETEHVKVVDAMSYVPSPSEKCHGSSYHITASPTLSSGSTLMSPKYHDQMFESPTSATDEFRVLAPPRRRVRRR